MPELLSLTGSHSFQGADLGKIVAKLQKIVDLVGLYDLKSWLTFFFFKREDDE